MNLERVSLENFRNYKNIKVGVDSALVVILGDNAAGKTNFLESVYFLSRIKSFRAPDNLLVKSGEDYFSIKGIFGETRLDITTQIFPSKKRGLKINDQKTKSLLWQSFPIVLFAPNDLNLFILGPVFRRKFLDEIISQLDREYALDLISLDHILKQKSSLLEQLQAGQTTVDQLDFWNQQLIPVGARIAQKRLGLIDNFNSRLGSKIELLTGFGGTYQLSYKGFGQSMTEAEFAERLESHKEAEMRSGQNLIGPHRDDFTLLKDGELNIYNSSRGELRSQILALKLLQAEYLAQTKIKPIVLLDDVFSELDEIRRTKLLENLTGHQIFITTTEEHHLPKFDQGALVLKVENNQVFTKN